jgi:hypothetical protein
MLGLQPEIKMDGSLAYILSRFFLYAILTTPLLSFFIVRKTQKGNAYKILMGILLTILLGGLFLAISMWFFVNSGKIT